MKAKELMIGDWVNFNTQEYPRFGMVNAINGNGVIEICHYAFVAEAISPIPLTAEILEKNGFERGEIFPSKFYRNIDNEQIMFCPYSRCYDIEYVHWNESNEADVTHHLDVQQPMNYVHELQHALRLCGLTELADNFKVE